MLDLNASADPMYQSYTGCLKTHDYTPLEPQANETKYYCAGVGVVLSVDLVTGEREELIAIQPS
ncbi:MAG TPA: hypothetical protein VGJ84_12805 [Polyangiaceae bacterium]